VTDTSDVRVRFCPSPTGNPHVGLVRTALYNYAWCRHVGGTFVFRIEDTDAARDSEASYRQLLAAMRWLGFDWDEGPEVGGPHGPYRQSERRGIYDDVARRLLESGHVYESFTTGEETEARHRAAGRDPKLGYDNHDRDLTDDQRAAFRAEGREPVLRFRMPDTDIGWDDLVRGEITFAANQVSDFVVVRANGDPLYTLTNPVDDAMMRVTHVLRGEDLLPSTPRQIALYRALVELGIAADTPRFGHLPYVMGEGNKKLSKRDPQASLDTYRAQGYLPEGLLNYLALLGWSIAPDHDVFSLQEMIAAFDIADVNGNPSRFDPAKCLAINGDHIRLLAPDDFAGRLVEFAGEYRDVDLDRHGDVLRAGAPLVQERCKTLGEAVDLLHFLVVGEAFALD
jgi:glutamyl-tRNA synthetase